MIAGASLSKSEQNFDNVSVFFGTPSQIIATLEKYNTASVVGFNPATFTDEASFYPSPEFNALVGAKVHFGIR